MVGTMTVVSSDKEHLFVPNVFIINSFFCLSLFLFLNIFINCMDGCLSVFTSALA